MTMTIPSSSSPTSSCRRSEQTCNWCNRLTHWKNVVSAAYLFCFMLQTLVYDSESFIIRNIMRKPARVTSSRSDDPIRLVNSRFVVLAKKLPDKEDEEEEEGIYYNDFGDFSSSSSSSQDDNNNNNLLDWSTLKSRITQTKDAIVERDNRLATNWRSGHWSVRGFKLDKYNPIQRLLKQQQQQSEDLVISVSKIALDAERSAEDIIVSGDDNTEEVSIAVGRTDGSICIVQLGKEYMTTFQAIPAISFQDTTSTTENSTTSSQVHYSSKLVPVDNDDFSPTDREEEKGDATPFQILHQFQASSSDSSISALFMEGTDVVTASANDGVVKLWELAITKETQQEEELVVIQPKVIFQGAHSKNVIVIKSLVIFDDASSNNNSEQSLLLTVSSSEGSIGIWNRETGHLIRCVHIQDPYQQQPIPILSADIWNDNNNNHVILFVGLDNGYVQGYTLQELLLASKDDESSVVVNPTPSCNFLAHGTQKGKSGVTALCCIGKGTTGLLKPSAKPSILLLTGGADGIVKQWEIFFSSSTDTSLLKLEHWPRIASQRMKRRAHIFEGSHGDKITALVGDASKILSAGADGRIVAWSPSTGEKMYSMDGFDDTLSNICLDKSLLITDGMSNYVCLHDFDLDQDSFEDSYELEF